MKKEIIKELSKKHSTPQSTTLEIINDFMNCIKEEVAKNGKAELRNFGVFLSRMQKGRKSNLPKANNAPAIQKMIVKFKISKKWGEELNRKDEK